MADRPDAAVRQIVEDAASGDLPGQRIGGQWRFGREALLRWLGATPNQAEAPRRA